MDGKLEDKQASKAFLEKSVKTEKSDWNLYQYANLLRDESDEKDE